jgi:signal transduction histidine kinase
VTPHKQATTPQAVVLVVDDDISSLALSREILQVSGYENLRCHSQPIDALAVIESEEIDLLIADLQMPEIDGLHLLQMLKKSVPQEGFVPVLIVTSDDSVETRRRALSLGADDYLTKPIDVVEMSLRVHHLLELRRMHMELSMAKTHLGSEVAARTEELQEAMVRLENLVKAKDMFIASVSHELRTPLTAVLGFAKELASESDRLEPSEIADSAAIIAEQATDLSAIIDDLLVAARIDIQAVSVLSESVDLRSELEAVVAAMGDNHRCRVTISDSHAEALGDHLRVRQILRNLLSNAIEHGGAHVYAEVESWGDFSTVTIIDDGPGISEEVQGRMFEPYFHGIGDSGQPESIGLGLAVFRFLARLMSGDLDLVPHPTATAFRLSLPSV